MEQGPEKRPRPGGRRLTAAGAALCLACAVVLTGGGGRTAQTAAPARLDLPRQEAVQTMAAAVGERVIPVGKAVGIKLFSDGVLVVGLSAVETQAGSRSPGRDCGLKEGDVITHINGEALTDWSQLTNWTTQFRPGTSAAFTLFRSEEETLELTVDFSE